MFFCFFLLLIKLAYAQSGVCGHNPSYCSFQYDNNTKSLVITGNGSMSSYSFYSYPPWHIYRQEILNVTIEGVTSIGGYAFEYFTSIQSITIPDSVTSIGERAFCQCGSLQNISIPNNIICLGRYAFSYCTSLQSITIPDSITSIGDSLFNFCPSLQSITIPNKVTSIGDSSFSSCSSLKNIIIPTSVTSIGNYAFSGCSSLQSITIPNSVTSIGERAFMYCRSLQSITIPNGVTSIGVLAFCQCRSLQSIKIPNNVTSIEGSAFESCTSLQSITIPNSVTSIGNFAFSWCTSLRSISIPNNVDSIGNSTFYGCTSLRSITIPNSVTHIGRNAFNGCTSLKSVTIPNSVISIQSKAFENCQSIESFIIEGYVDEIKEYAFSFNEINYVNFEYHSNSPPQNCSNIDPNNNLMLLPIFSENMTLINVPKNYESNVFCSCDKYGCPIQYVKDNEYDKIKQASVPIEKTLDKTNATYCSYEQESEIHFYAICDECSCLSYATPISESLCNMGDLNNYSKVVVNVTDSYQTFVFGNLTNPFISKELIINLEQQITNYSPYFVFNYLQNDLPLTINSSYPINKLLFYFDIGNSPTRIFGNVDGLKIRISDNLIYNLPRQRTFFGNAINSTTYSHLDLYPNYFGYGISSFGDKFSSTSSNVVKVSCGGMYRYYSYNPTEIKINSITAICNKTFNENDYDDFDSFIVTTKLSLLSDNQYFFLSSSNIIVESMDLGYYDQNIYTYPNMFYKYVDTGSVNIFGTNERKGKLNINLEIFINSKTSSTSIMEVQNEDKTLSTYIIAISQSIKYLTFETFIETETIKSQVMIIGLENQEISRTKQLCKTIIRKPSFEQCYSCSEGSYFINGTCSNEKVKCFQIQGSKCISCNNGYYVSNGTCQEITNNDINCINSVNNTYCSECKEGYYLKEGICELKDVNCLKYGNGVCLKCQFGYQLINNKCEQGIDSHCYYEKDQCIECLDDSTLNGNSCIVKDENKNGINEIIYCKGGYYIENGTCNQCINSSYCAVNQKFNCLEGYYNDNNTCISKTCDLDENGKCGIEIRNCKENSVVNGRCVDCKNGYYPNINGECTTQIDNCDDQNTKGCKRCSDGYYLDSNLQCQQCSSECLTCTKSSNYCLSCENSKYLSNNKCLETEELKETCHVLLLHGSGCAICKSGYYREGKGCNKCQDKCKSCIDNSICIKCNSDYFMNNENDCILKSVIVGCEVEITEVGCNRCKDGYYKYKSNQCEECSGGCFTCSNEIECNTCIDEYVIDNKQCVSYHHISHCVDAKESKCSECSFWYQPSSDGTYCSIHISSWIILLIVLICLAIISLFVMIIYFFIRLCTKRYQMKKMRKDVTIFKLKKSSMSFIDLGDNIVINSNEILFNEGKRLPVNKEITTKVSIGNTSKQTMKIQITMKESNLKYSIEAIPNIIILNNGEVCEFELKLKMLCTCKLKENVMIVSKLKNKKKEIIKSVSFEVESEISTRIDPDELKEDKKLGEGAFGIVYLGTFRGNKVAIKKIKKINETTLKEFSKEVSMLDKFRSEYIIHFYGAVFIPKKICMVTEFAQFGSLQDLIKKRKEEPISDYLRNKIILDSAKGIEYLHSNGILHRDIKPDNILVVTLNENDLVNAKLTDFGSSRNINMLMTNMTFTKDIGSPAYMSPEILNREKYKMPSDVYSFAITMYECFGWCECYPKTLFCFRWDVADFVNDGKRRPKPDNMTNEQYELVEQCWKQNPKERITIGDVVDHLKQLKSDVKEN